MNVQCILCKEIVPIGQFRSSEAGLDVDCAACGGRFFVESGDGTSSTSSRDAPAPEHESPGDDALECPKCGESQPDADACRACGLRAELFDAFEVAAPEASADLQPLWERCLEEWDDAAAHDAFVDTASATSSFAFAARRYREFLRKCPEDTRAPKQLSRLSRMAEATLLSAAVARNKLPEADEPYKNVMILLLFLVLLGGIAGVWVLLKNAASDPEPAPNVPVQTTPKKR